MFSKACATTKYVSVGSATSVRMSRDVEAIEAKYKLDYKSFSQCKHMDQQDSLAWFKLCKIRYSAFRNISGNMRICSQFLLSLLKIRFD